LQVQIGDQGHQTHLANKSVSPDGRLPTYNEQNEEKMLPFHSPMKQVESPFHVGDQASMKCKGGGDHHQTFFVANCNPNLNPENQSNFPTLDYQRANHTSNGDVSGVISDFEHENAQASSKVVSKSPNRRQGESRNDSVQTANFNQYDQPYIDNFDNEDSSSIHSDGALSVPQDFIKQDYMSLQYEEQPNFAVQPTVQFYGQIGQYPPTETPPMLFDGGRGYYHGAPHIGYTQLQPQIAANQLNLGQPQPGVQKEPKRVPVPLKIMNTTPQKKSPTSKLSFSGRDYIREFKHKRQKVDEEEEAAVGGANNAQVEVSIYLNHLWISQKEQSYDLFLNLG
jgi:hypothetical protein